MGTPETRYPTLIPLIGASAAVGLAFCCYLLLSVLSALAADPMLAHDCPGACWETMDEVTAAQIRADNEAEKASVLGAMAQ